VSSHWKPEGYPSVSPYLVAAGAARVIDFLEAAAFGATRLRRYDLPDGSVMHGGRRGRAGQGARAPA